MSNSIDSIDNINTVNATEPPQSPVAVPGAPGDWRGMTLEELRRARAKALIRREVGRATMQYSIDGMKTNVANNGVRALFFSPGTVSHLKKVDYVVLGFRLTRWLMGLWRHRR